MSVSAQFEKLQVINGDLSIALSAISNVNQDPELKAKATASELTLVNAILIDMTSLMIAINHQLLTLPTAMDSALANDKEQAVRQLEKLVDETQLEFDRIRTMFKSIVHLLRQ